MCHRTAGTPKEAIKRAIEEMNIWKQCQGCSMYVRNLNDNQKCFQCLLSATIMDEIPKEQKFVCAICGSEQMDCLKQELECGHDMFCQLCCERYDFQCPLCEKHN